MPLFSLLKDNVKAINQIVGQPVANEFDHWLAILDATIIHSAIIVATAFKKGFSGPEWEPPRKYARRFLLEHLNHDVQQIHVILTTIPSLETGEERILPPIPSSYGALWESVRSSIRNDDLEGYEFLLQAVSKAAFLVPLPPSRLSIQQESLMRPRIEKMLQTVNSAITNIHKDFNEIILRLVDNFQESSLTVFCRRPGVGSLVIGLLLSPIKSLSDGAQTLIGQAYDASGRTECLRALLESQWDSAIAGIISQLESFNSIATQYLDVVDTAKVLVLCYTDILDILCAIPHGLLFNEQFIRRNKGSLRVMPQLWRGMCNAAGVIIEQTPNWAKRYQQSHMTPWMRDALIFGNELVEKRRLFESVLITSDRPSQSPKGVILVQDFSVIMRPLVSWLRLSHQELLDLSYQLLKDLFGAFKETSSQPDEKLLQTIEAFVNKLSGGGKHPKAAQQRTRLSISQLGTILRLIADLRGDEDSDIEFVSQVFSPKKPSTAPVNPPAARPLKPLRLPLPVKGNDLKPLPSGTKTGGLMERLQKGVGDGFLQRGLDKKMVESAITERKVGKSSSTVNLASSSAGEQFSSSSESESEDDVPSGLVQLSKLQKSPLKLIKPEKKRTILLNDASKLPISGKPIESNASRHPQVQEQRIRYTPDMAPLHRIILSWDYDFNGPEPPTTGGPLVLKAVPDRFSSYRQYLDIMHPLLIVECWNSLIKSKEEPLDKVPITVAGKMHSDFWVEIDAVVGNSVPKGWVLLDTDIILLEHATGKRTLAKVHSSRESREGIQATIRYSSERNDMDLERAMKLNSTWSVSRVFR